MGEDFHQQKYPTEYWAKLKYVTAKEHVKKKPKETNSWPLIHVSWIHSNYIIMLTPLSLVVMRKLLYLKITRHTLQTYENKIPRGLMILVPNMQHN